MKHLFMILLTATMLLSSCVNTDKRKEHDALADTDPEASLKIEQPDSEALKREQDSLTFTSTHHYTNNYNFVVIRDSLTLFVQQPEEIVALHSERVLTDNISQTEEEMPETPLDTVELYRDERVVVAQIRTIPTDSIDSVWVQLARDQSTFGWIHESELLPNVVPDDPISQFINVFSNQHLVWMLGLVVLIIVFYTLRIVNKKGAKIVHFNDIPSFYPTALVLAVAIAATLYSTIQVFEPEMWRHFYYHPTLNPFTVPPLLGMFLFMVWALPIICVATIDDVRRHLPVNEAILYLSGTAAVCMIDYVVFSLSTLYYIGYPLLALYLFFAIKTFNSNRRLVYFCGRCGKAIHHKGVCPYCGALNE